MAVELQIVLNGQVLAADQVAGLSAFSQTVRRKDSQGLSALSFTGELTFYGEGFEALKSIPTSPAAHLIQVPIQIYSTCCLNDDGSYLLLFDGMVDGSTAEWCEVSPRDKCWVKAALVDATLTSKKIACLKNTIIWDRKPKFGDTVYSGGEDAGRPARYLTYCNDMRPRALQEGLMILGILYKITMIPLLFAFAIVVSVINVIIGILNIIIDAINVLPGISIDNINKVDFDGNDDTSVFDEGKNLIEAFNDAVVGCGRKHKAPFVASYLQNVCDVCGLSLVSSQFGQGGPLYNLMRLDASQYEGKRQDAGVEQAYTDNRPNLNGLQFLETLKDLNLEWRVEGASLHIEVKDTGAPAIWFTQSEVDVVSLCLQFTDQRPPAYGVYGYSKDGIDGCGDEVRNDWGAVVNWNEPPVDAQAGAHEVNLPYSAALFRKDNQSDETLPIDKPFYDDSIAYPNLKTFKNVMLLQRGVSLFPKLLLWDGASARKDARVWRNPQGGKWDYNVPMWFRETYTPDPTTQTLYQRNFADTDNPRTTGAKVRRYTLKVKMTCTLLKGATDARFVEITTSGVSKIATVEEITIDHANNSITIQGRV